MASGQTLYTFTPQANQPPAPPAATPDVRNGMLVLDFDPTVYEVAVFVGIMPRHYGGGGLTVYLHLMASSATSGTMRWLLNIERHLPGTDDSDVDSFMTLSLQAAAVAVSPSGTEVVLAVVFPAGAGMDNIAAGERFRLRVGRDGAGSTGTDDMAGDAELVAIEIKET